MTNKITYTFTLKIFTRPNAFGGFNYVERTAKGKDAATAFLNWFKENKNDYEAINGFEIIEYYPL